MDCVDTVTSVVYSEARGESDKGIKGVVHVILNRAREKGKRPCQVVKERRQFAKGQYKPTDPDWQRIKALIQCPGPDFTRGATYFHAKWARPYWTKYAQVTTRYGGHIFYKT